MKVMFLNTVLSFSDLFKPKMSEDGTTEKFSGNFILDKDSKIIIEGKAVKLKKLLKKCDDMFLEKLGIKSIPKGGYENWAVNKADGSTTRKPYVSSKTNDYYAGTDEDTYYITASVKKEDCKGGKLFVCNQLKEVVTHSDDVIYSGCRVNVSTDIYAYNKNKKGVTASLAGVQKCADGARLGVSKVNAIDEFDEVVIDDDYESDDDVDTNTAKGAVDVSEESEDGGFE